MQCEICGSETRQGKRILLDGSEMLACEACARFGIEKESPKKTENKIFLPEETKKDFDFGFGLKNGYGKSIGIARQKQGLTFEELGKKIFEPVSLLRRIEAEKIKPSDKIIAKLEKELKIKLCEK